MAKMIPEKLSSEILLDPKRQGEIKVYNFFQKRLGNDWTIFHSVSWLAKVFASGDTRDGETDFIIAHPKYGIIVAEVKGGIKIIYNGETDNWQSENKRGNVFDIKNPFYQARDNKYSLLTAIKSWRGWEKGLYGVNICHAVIFPDVSRLSGILPIYAKDEITIFEDDFTDIAKKLIGIINYACNDSLTDSEKTRKIINDICCNIAPSFILKRKLVNYISDDEQEIIHLTENQFYLLRMMQQIKRASISGCAGSGKTMLAIKKAEMLARSGYNILLCCFNTLLGKEFAKEANRNVGVVGGNYHLIIYNILFNAFKINESIISKIIDDDNKIMEIMLSNESPQFDAIIIDEAQDFNSTQLEILELMLVPDGILYCFWDNNQRLLRPDFTLPNDLQPYNLDTNLRNTEKIFSEVKKFYVQQNPIYHSGPEGRDIKICSPYNSIRPKELKQKLTNELLQLINNESVAQQDITVLTFKSKVSSALSEFTIPGVRISTFDNNYKNDCVRLETIRRFKGMESPVVILTELDDFNAMNDNELWENLCYVAISRARHYLIILSPDSTYERISK